MFCELLTQVGSAMDRLSLLLVDHTQISPFVQQQLHHLQRKNRTIRKVFTCQNHSKCLSQRTVIRATIGLLLPSPPGSRSERRGAGRCGPCGPPCSGCSAGSEGSPHSERRGWRPQRAAASARTCPARWLLLRVAAEDPLPSARGNGTV